MSYERCPRCEKFCWDNRCKCTRYEAAVPYRDKVDDDDWREVYAQDAEAVAESFAERYDYEGDYTFARHTNGEVWVRDEDGVVTKWAIDTEQVVNYHASAMAPAPSNPEGDK